MLGTRCLWALAVVNGVSHCAANDELQSDGISSIYEEFWVLTAPGYVVFVWMLFCSMVVYSLLFDSHRDGLQDWKSIDLDRHSHLAFAFPELRSNLAPSTDIDQNRLGHDRIYYQQWTHALRGIIDESKADLLFEHYANVDPDQLKLTIKLWNRHNKHAVDKLFDDMGVDTSRHLTPVWPNMRKLAMKSDPRPKETTLEKKEKEDTNVGVVGAKKRISSVSDDNPSENTAISNGDVDHTALSKKIMTNLVEAVHLKNLGLTSSQLNKRRKMEKQTSRKNFKRSNSAKGSSEIPAKKQKH